MLIIIRGAGDLASGIALRLHRSGFTPLMTDIEKPTAIRRTVAFSECIYKGETEIEGVVAKKSENAKVGIELINIGIIAVLVDEKGDCISQLKPDVVIDAILAKKNLGTSIDDAPVVIALGPGFYAGRDCHAVIETQRGHDLGRVIYDGQAKPNTGVPALIDGEGLRRILRAPCSGVFHALHSIGDFVSAGDVIATVNGVEMSAEIDGVLRGIMPEGALVTAGMKSGDIDPRAIAPHCFTVSDKARSLGGAVLEAILNLHEGAFS